MNSTKSDTALASKPSSSFSTTSSAASATSATSSRSGGSKLLFGEIDLNSERSSESFASVCSLVLCESSTLLKFWLDDTCRETFLSFLPRSDLVNLRLACHDFSVRAAPALFSDLAITFRTNTFTRPSKLAALDRLGFYVKTLRFIMSHTPGTFLPPLIEPETGAEMSFTYAPQTQEPSSRQPKYGDAGTTAILTRQYPPLFHAATNIPAFVRAFSSFMNLKYLDVSCPGYDPTQGYRRSVVDYALISLRIAIEKNCLNALDSLTLSPIHPGGLICLSPLGLGASPRSASRWARIKNLKIKMIHLPSGEGTESEPEQSKLLRSYFRSFKHLESFRFGWVGERGPFPLRKPCSPTSGGERGDSTRRPEFPTIRCIEIENVTASATEVGSLVDAHGKTIEELDLHDIDLTGGTWDDALAPLTSRARRRTVKVETAHIPIMLSIDTCAIPYSARVDPTVVAHHSGVDGRRSSRRSRWSSSRRPSAVQKVKNSLMGCEEQLRKVLKGSVFTWN